MDLKSLFEQAMARQRAGDLETAERLYAQIMAASPTNFAAHYMLGVVRLQQNRHAEALELVDFESNPGTIKAAVESIRAFTHLPASVTPPCSRIARIERTRCWL